MTIRIVVVDGVAGYAATLASLRSRRAGGTPAPTLVTAMRRVE
jgi:hypothetical protein